MKYVQRILFTVTVIWIGIFLNTSVYAGPYTDDLTKCIVESTTIDDRIEFVKWLFTAMSKHPAVKSLSSITDEQVNDSNEKIAKLLMKLLTESCREKAQKAIKYEGQVAIKTSFQMLGQVAAQELFSNPEVATSISDLDKYINVDELKSSLGIE